jgi:hypothetical protein
MPAELLLFYTGADSAAWKPENNLYGSMRTDKEAACIRRESERLDQQLLRQGAKWLAIEEDDTAGGALPEHKEGYEKLVLRGAAYSPGK